MLKASGTRSESCEQYQQVFDISNAIPIYISISSTPPTDDNQKVIGIDDSITIEVSRTD